MGLTWSSEWHLSTASDLILEEKTGRTRETYLFFPSFCGFLLCRVLRGHLMQTLNDSPVGRTVVDLLHLHRLYLLLLLIGEYTLKIAGHTGTTVTTPAQSHMQLLSLVNIPCSGAYCMWDLQNSATCVRIGDVCLIITQRSCMHTVNLIADALTQGCGQLEGLQERTVERRRLRRPSLTRGTRCNLALLCIEQTLYSHSAERVPAVRQHQRLLIALHQHRHTFRDTKQTCELFFGLVGV